ncbi:hypothetical protein F5Y03DRAFT_379710 [Xylaria venustula]|nr:hypothetical protein F5Y03DRAFT_379710 [Xylaria venustula]
MARTRQTNRRRSRSRQTSSYLEVQELSPPSSSSPSPSGPSSSQHPRKLPDEIPSSTARVTRSGTRYGETIQCTAPERVVAQSRETAKQTQSSTAETSRSAAAPARRSTASSSQKAKEQQTTKLVNVLVKNKSLTYKCMDEDKDACKALMMKICKTVDDPRFKTWRQVKSWAKTHHRKRRGNKLRLSTPSSSRRMPPKTQFEKNLAPIINVTEMNTNAKVFLSSVIDTLGTSKLTRAFRHRLARGELPEDIAPLIFSPLYLKMCRKQIEKVTAARNANYSDSDGFDDSEWSDWEGDYDECNRGNGSMTATGAYPFIIPSIEDDDGNTRETIEEDDDTLIREGGPVERLADEERIDRPSTPTKATEAELHEHQMRTTRRVRRREKGDARNSENDKEHHNRCQQLTSSPCPQNSLASRPMLDQNRVRNQAGGAIGARDESLEILCPPTPRARPFADLMSQTATTQGFDTRSVSRIASLLRNTNERRGNEGLNVASVARASKKHSGSIDTNQRKEGGPRKRTEKNDQTNTASVSSATDNSRSIYQPKAGLSSTRRTCLVMENGRLREKVVEPAKPRGPYREIPPPVFYNEPTGRPTMMPRVNPELRVRDSQQHKPSLEHTINVERRVPNRQDRDRKTGRSNGTVSNNVQIQQQRSWSYPSHIFDSDSDDDENFPPIEEIFEDVFRKGLVTSHTTNPQAMSTRANTSAQLQRARGNVSSERKRHRRERSGSDSDIPASSSTKRMRSTSSRSASAGKRSLDAYADTFTRISNTHPKRRGSSAAIDIQESTFRHAVRSHKSVPANYGRGRGESIASSSGSAPPPAKRRRGQKFPWRIVDSFL